MTASTRCDFETWRSLEVV